MIFSLWVMVVGIAHTIGEIIRRRMGGSTKVLNEAVRRFRDTMTILFKISARAEGAIL
jgi:hypothetical protein